MQKIEEPTALQFEFSRIYPDIVLASQSPNRRRLLELGGTHVTAIPQDTDETLCTEDHAEAIRINAERKLRSYMDSKEFDPEKIAISADTLVLINGELYGKPRNLDDARHTLTVLAGNRQVVLTGCGIYVPGKGVTTFTDEATVWFKDLGCCDIEEYLATGEWEGAAGAYRFQKTGYTLIDRIEGDWTTVVGLPLQRLINLSK